MIQTTKSYQKLQERKLGEMLIGDLLCALLDELELKGIIDLDEFCDRVEARFVMEKISE